MTESASGPAASVSTERTGPFAVATGWVRRMPGAVRAWYRSWTLRRKLVAAVVTLVAILGIAIGSVSVTLLHTYLIERVDVQLTYASERASEVAQSYYQRGALPSTAQAAQAFAYQVVTATGQPGGTFAALVGTDGTLIGGAYLPTGSASTANGVKVENFQSTMAALVPGEKTSVNLRGQLGEYRVESQTLPGGLAIVIGLPVAEAEGTTVRLAIIMLIATGAAAFFAAGIGLLIVRLSLRPLDRVAGAAEAVSTLPLDRGEVALRVRVADEDTDPRTEVGRVGSAFNAMLGHVASALSAREASERKVRQFVSDASHELRTPLASIRGYSELTRRSPEALPPEVQHSIGRIESEAKRMTTIVEDLLLLARLDEGRELDREPVDLSMLLINLLSDAHAAGPDHQWRLDLPPEPVEVVGDQPRLHQVFANLLTNARVHTPAGTSVDLAMRVSGDSAIITVSDDGPGVPPELQPVLFERFARGDSSRSRETGSTGLGLAIVKAVVDAHRGAIWVESAPGKTVFTVRLPLAAAA